MTCSVTLVAEDLLRIDCASQPTANALAQALRSGGDWLEVVAGADCVVVQFDNAVVDAGEALRLAAAVEPLTTAGARRQPVEVPVCYDGEFAPDMHRVCEELQLDREALIDAHTAGMHRVRMLGFTPGFAYVDGLDQRLSVGRLAEPRAYVEPGSIGIAGTQTGIYAMPGPGGWKLIGRTPLRLFDAASDPPFLLSPDDPVRFTPISAGEFARMQDA